MKSHRPVVVRSLIVGCTAIASLIAAGFIRLNLRILPAPVTKNTPKAGGKNTLKRTNATITIRNGNTQQVESTGRVATRRLFKERPTAPATARVTATPAITVSVAPALSIQMPKKNPAQALVPAAPTSASPATVIKLVPAPAARPVVNVYPPSAVTPTRTIIGAQSSILLAPEFEDFLLETTDARISFCR